MTPREIIIAYTRWTKRHNGIAHARLVFYRLTFETQRYETFLKQQQLFMENPGYRSEFE